MTTEDDELRSAPARALAALDVPADVAARHLARLTAAPAPVVALRPRRTALRATVGGVVLATTLGAGAGVAAAAGAQPGDALYGVKTARERLQLAMARPGDSRARLELKLARTRLGEAAELLRAGDAARAVETLARADAALASAGAHGGADVDREVAGELDHRVAVLGGLLDGGLPDTAADAAREALDRALDRTVGRGAGRRPTPPAGPAATPSVTPSRRPATPPATPGARPTAKPDTPPPSHPGRSDHPTGRPTAPPGRGR